MSDQHAPASSESTLVTETKARLLPEFISNAVETVNCISRVTLKTAQGLERTVDGLDEITTLMLKQQRQRLLSELEPA